MYKFSKYYIFQHARRLTSTIPAPQGRIKERRNPMETSSRVEIAHRKTSLQESHGRISIDSYIYLSQLTQNYTLSLHAIQWGSKMFSRRQRQNVANCHPTPRMNPAYPKQIEDGTIITMNSSKFHILARNDRHLRAKCS